MQERRQQDRRLAGADHDHVPADEGFRVGHLGAVQGEAARQALQGGRGPAMEHAPGRENHLFDDGMAPVVEGQVEAAPRGPQVRELAVLHLRHVFLAKPVRVVEEIRQRQRRADGPVSHPPVPKEVLEHAGPARVPQVGREGLGLQQQAFRHVRAPALHRRPGDLERDVPGPQVRREGEAVGTRPDDHGFDAGHGGSLLQRLDFRGAGLPGSGRPGRGMRATAPPRPASGRRPPPRTASAGDRCAATAHRRRARPCGACPAASAA